MPSATSPSAVNTRPPWHRRARLAAGRHLLRHAPVLEARLYGLRTVRIGIGEQALTAFVGGPQNAAHTVLMLHGYSADRHVWTRFAKPLLREQRVIIPDLAGHGDSPFHADWHYGAAAQASRIANLLDACNLDRVHVVGNSMGGLIAAQLALDHAPRVASLAVFDPYGVSSAEPSELQRLLDDGHNPFLMHTTGEFPFFYDMVMAQPPWLPGIILDAVAEHYVARRSALARIFEDFSGHGQLDGRLAVIDTPTLVLWGREDRLIHVSAAHAWSSGIAGAQLEIWDGIGHMPMVEAPGRSAALYRSFLQRVTAGAGQTGPAVA